MSDQSSHRTRSNTEYFNNIDLATALNISMMSNNNNNNTNSSNNTNVNNNNDNIRDNISEIPSSSASFDYIRQSLSTINNPNNNNTNNNNNSNLLRLLLEKFNIMETNYAQTQHTLSSLYEEVKSLREYKKNNTNNNNNTNTKILQTNNNIPELSSTPITKQALTSAVNSMRKELANKVDNNTIIIIIIALAKTQIVKMKI